jgi:hypothetical protein
VRYEFKPSFDRSVKSRSPSEKVEIVEACLEFLDVLERHHQVAAGAGLKRLRGDFWEARAGLKNRILFRWREDTIEFILAGSHDSIKRFLRNS